MKEEPKKTRINIRLLLVVAIGIFIGQVIIEKIHIETYINSLIGVFAIKATIDVTAIYVVDAVVSFISKKRNNSDEV